MNTCCFMMLCIDRINTQLTNLLSHLYITNKYKVLKWIIEPLMCTHVSVETLQYACGIRLLKIQSFFLFYFVADLVKILIKVKGHCFAVILFSRNNNSSDFIWPKSILAQHGFLSLSGFIKQTDVNASV